MIWLPILLAVFMLLVVPFCVKAEIHYNLNENSGKVCLYFGFIKLFTKEFMFGTKGIVIKNKKSKTILPYINFGKSGVGDGFIFYLLKSAKINTVKSDISIGIDDCFATSIVCGYVLVIEKILMSVLSCNRNITVKRVIVEPSFCKNNIEASFCFSLGINLLLVIISFCAAMLNIKKEMIVYGKQSN